MPSAAEGHHVPVVAGSPSGEDLIFLSGGPDISLGLTSGMTGLRMPSE
jgi:hypothetical protein